MSNEEKTESVRELLRMYEENLHLKVLSEREIAKHQAQNVERDAKTATLTEAIAKVCFPEGKSGEEVFCTAGSFITVTKAGPQVVILRKNFSTIR